jgi:hypothetical protein
LWSAPSFKVASTNASTAFSFRSDSHVVLAVLLLLQWKRKGVGRVCIKHVNVTDNFSAYSLQVELVKRTVIYQITIRFDDIVAVLDLQVVSRSKKT